MGLPTGEKVLPRDALMERLYRGCLACSGFSEEDKESDQRPHFELSIHARETSRKHGIECHFDSKQIWWLDIPLCPDRTNQTVINV
jgi:hypothetical protein